jgi:DnaJ-domain-containing protein 1
MMQALRRILPILFSLLYVLSPLDLLPDLLPGVGWIDDLLVIAALLVYLRASPSGRTPWEVFGRMGWTRHSPGGVRPEDLRADFSQADPYELLEIPRGASDSEIKTAYKRAVTRYHPDKVAHLGKEFQELAHKKLLAIQQAYETLGGRH